MLKVIVGYIRVDSEDTMEEISGIINGSNCTVEEEEPDYMLVTDIDPYAMDKLFKDGYITEEDYMEIPLLNSIKFYID